MKKAFLKKYKLDSPYIWSFTTYIAEGFPFSMFRTLSGVFFRDMKVSLETIGLTSLFGLPWMLKFLWGPQVDAYSTKRRWMLSMQFLLLAIFVSSALVAPLKFNVQAIFVLFFIGAIIAATHDIAIDGYYMEALDKQGQAKFVGYRTMAYRIAMMAGSGIIITIGTTKSWFLAFLAASFIFGLFFVYHFFFLPEMQKPQHTARELLRQVLKIKNLAILSSAILFIIGIRQFFQSSIYASMQKGFPLLKKISFAHWVAIILLLALIAVGIFRKQIAALFTKNSDSYYSKAFVYFMEREKIGIILGFIITLRIGEWTLANMVSPFIVDLGIKAHYGWIAGAVGLPAAIAGALIGGWMISRFTIKKVIYPFILLQNLTNVVYMFLALHLADFIRLNTGAENPVFMGVPNLVFVAAVDGFDQFAAGLGNAVLMTYLMRICHTKFKAAHYAIGSGLMNVSAPFAGVMSGIIAGWLGYAWLFGVSFALSVPAMLLIPFLPYLNEEKKNAANG